MYGCMDVCLPMQAEEIEAVVQNTRFLPWFCKTHGFYRCFYKTHSFYCGFAKPTVFDYFYPQNEHFLAQNEYFLAKNEYFLTKK